MPDVATIMTELDRAAHGLDALSKDLAALERVREPIEIDYEGDLEKFVADLWEQYTRGEVKTWPGAEVRLSLFHAQVRATPDGKERLEQLGALRGRRKRLMSRIDDVRSGISARQSILSALKIEMEASR